MPMKANKMPPAMIGVGRFPKENPLEERDERHIERGQKAEIELVIVCRPTV